jgi:hypothetical protein
METWGQNSVKVRKLSSPDQCKAASASGVLRELFELLEDYAPAWYTEEHHKRATAALSEIVPRAAAS